MFGKIINNTRVVPITLKIVFFFALFILVSNLTSNYINLVYNREAFLKQVRQLLVKDLKSLSEFANIQHEIYQYQRDLESSKQKLEEKGLQELQNKKALVLGIRTNGNIFFQSSRVKRFAKFEDQDKLSLMIENFRKNKKEGFISFEYNEEAYFGIYKYNPKWDIFLLRAEEYNEFYSQSRSIFWNISVIIIIITLACAVVGIFILRYILRFIGIISKSLMRMIKNQQLELIELKDAPNDDITFLGIAFNSLSNTIDNLVTIFKKFANREVAMKAYQEREIRLEGTMKELTVLFSDIKGFTFITETLGSDIIKLINMHYDRAIREIEDLNGVIGSIIGDAILAMFGVSSESEGNKSYQAVQSAYKVQEVCEQLRLTMHKRKEEIVRKRGALTKEEEKIYKAVLLEIGIGLDGGEVFYGNIGSQIRMTNTVIGDNVNSAARLEGLTRVYKVPVICSEYVKDDIEKNVKNHGLHFIELDRVQVKGKTMGKQVFWPILKENYDKALQKEISVFSSALQLYYEGRWRKAFAEFEKCKLPLAGEFLERTRSGRTPKRWDGVWTMKTK
ncbi:MAG: adenylate/guanylate cyclase domain-containing protein [Spirochaetes bacterium]|nr:adenylate/guanylate cyclase domain-containing protein [Spirochaetota bacterium]